MEAQLVQAQRLGYDVVWWTEHDWRMASKGYLDQLPVTGASSDGVTWSSSEDSTGDHDFVGNPPSGGPAAALRVQATGNRGSHALHRVIADVDGHLYRTSLHGQEWTVLVHPEHLEAGFLGLDLRTSWRPANEGREEGFYRISYRFGPTDYGSRTIGDRQVEVRLPASPGEWTELVLHPVDDFSTAWPTLDGRDASCVEVSLLAEAQSGGSATGLFGGVSIRRADVEEQAPLATQRDLIGRYAEAHLPLHQLQGLEVSQNNPHLCWYGGTPRLLASAQDSSLSIMDRIRQGGGVVSYAHPFGVGGQPVGSSPQLDMALSVLEKLLTSHITACDAIEIGYRARGGATLDTHESLWDALSRRGIFLTGLGVNDDHVGRDWTESPNNFGSWIWAAAAVEEELVAALRDGHVYFGDPTLFSGQLDIRPAAGGHMGSVITGSAPTSEVRLVAEDLPAGSHLELLHFEMAVDAEPAEAAAISVFRADEIQQGAVTTVVTTENNCIVRTRVRDNQGDTIALSNPVWFVLDETDYQIPGQRRVHALT